MTTMISEVYAAFLSIGVSPEIAQKAAEALSSESAASNSDIQNLEKSVMSVWIDLQKDISGVKTDIAVLKWMVGLVMAGVGAQLVKSFFV